MTWYAQCSSVAYLKPEFGEESEGLDMVGMYFYSSYATHLTGIVVPLKYCCSPDSILHRPSYYFVCARDSSLPRIRFSSNFCFAHLHPCIERCFLT